MRLGILSDIHANYEALSAVVEAFKSEEVDRYYCLGDTVGYGGSPTSAPTWCARWSNDHPRQPRGRRRGRWTTRIITRRPATRSDLHAQLLVGRNMACSKDLPYQIKLPEPSVNLCHGSPVRLEEFEYSSRPSKRANACPSSRSSRPSR